jgi:hypothetical protein
MAILLSYYNAIVIFVSSSSGAPSLDRFGMLLGAACYKQVAVLCVCVLGVSYLLFVIIIINYYQKWLVDL